MNGMGLNGACWGSSTKEGMAERENWCINGRMIFHDFFLKSGEAPA